MAQVLSGLSLTIVIVMWIECALAAAFTAARFISRAIGVTRLGCDDIFIGLTAIFLTLWTILSTVSATRGFGQHSATLTHDQFMAAYQYELIGQTFGIFAAAASKSAVGLFQLRIVETHWVRWLIWFLITVMATACIFEVFIDYLQCIPPDHIWNPTVPANCWMSLGSYIAFSKFVAAWAIVCDFSFAAIPWIVVWPLNMSRSRRVSVCVFMSWGVLAGICGIVRFLSIDSLSERMDYTYDMVGLILWSSTETLVTLGAACLPTYRELYLRLWKPQELDGASFGLDANPLQGGRCRCSPPTTKSEDPLVLQIKEAESESSVFSGCSFLEGSQHPRAPPPALFVQ